MHLGFCMFIEPRDEMAYITQFGLIDSVSYSVGGIKIGRSGALYENTAVTMISPIRTT